MGRVAKAAGFVIRRGSSWASGGWRVASDVWSGETAPLIAARGRCRPQGPDFNRRVGRVAGEQVEGRRDAEYRGRTRISSIFILFGAGQASMNYDFDSISSTRNPQS